MDSLPSSTNATTAATWAGVMASSSSPMPASLAFCARKFPHQARAASLDAPCSTVAATNSTAPALTRSRITSSETPHSC
ncbi:Uncharacterised protein [Mycobacterium tuberculosis]|nr:Uncharacterised protein [Mycobacterium tuberculosis]COZ49832.1 Uncharacterised protein [Mycobacterium tuberculosis]